MLDLKQQIIFEDQDIILINKPPGLVVNRADSNRDETFEDWLAAYLRLDEKPLADKKPTDEKTWQILVPSDFDDSYGSPEQIFLERRGLVHRLDKNTSGVLLAAKNPGALVNLLRQFRLRQTRKQYLCLTHGKFQLPQGVISLPLGRASSDRKKFAVVAEGRPAVTYYKVIKYYSGLNLDRLQQLIPAEEWKGFKKATTTYQQGFSLVECYPKTGRTHQIRVHMMHERHPLVGDQNYMGKSRGKTDGAWCRRHFLHAQWLEFTHPRTDQVLRIEAPLAHDLEMVLNLLEE
ncbi:MAG: RluA family pseudouridine synthase [Patescibacteria group bacterium]